jgi:hypothetical protein
MPALGILDHQMAKVYRKNKQYLKKPYRKNNSKTLSRFFFYRSRRERHLNLLYNYFNPELTEHWAIMGFKNGIVYRYPLLDKRIIEYVLTIPSHLMVRNETERILIRDLCKDLLPESVLKIKVYIDPVYFSTRRILTREVGDSLMDEVKVWVNNPDLDFFNFDKLQKDIDLYKKDPTNEKLGGFKQTLVYLKMLHEFTKTYRSFPKELE